jgi:hypothetical protein
LPCVSAAQDHRHRRSQFSIRRIACWILKS